MNGETATSSGSGTEPIFCLHFLGGSGREWQSLAARLEPRLRCVPIDLPGFGDSRTEDGYDVAAMADFVANRITSEGAERWWIAGHSMGAKVASAIARRVADGDEGLRGLRGVVLVAGSPPSPEPMAEKRRQTMLGWFKGDEAQSRKEADGFIRQSVGDDLSPALHETAVADVLRLEPKAWRAWLERGSKEDWSDRIGVLPIPAVIVAGGEDADLGPKAQADKMRPHYPEAEIVTLDGAGHLLPLERPGELAAAILKLVDSIENSEGLDPDYRRFLDLPRVGSATRAALVQRLEPLPVEAAQQALGPERWQILKALGERVIPQGPDHPIEFATAIGIAVSKGPGDGWRFADLPADLDAYRAGLDTLEAAARAARGSGFADLASDAQDELLDRMAEGKLDAGSGSSALLDAARLKLWFEEVRSDHVKLYMAHPTTYARIGYSGPANGGDGPRKIALAKVGLGEEEGWEPQPAQEALR